MPHQPPSIVFGGTRIGNRPLFMPETSLGLFLGKLADHGVRKIDTAQSYGNSEETLGKVEAGKTFTIDTKWSPPSFTEAVGPWATRDNIVHSAEESIRKLGVEKVDVFYLHRPDPQTPLAETLGAVNEVYSRGLFHRFGLSGCSSSQVEAVHAHCLANSYPLPAVYQGSYNAFSRAKETTLIPTLRALQISFYAYSPSAGGFLGKSAAQARQLATNLDSVSATCKPYLREARFLDALDVWNTIADNEGISPAELSYRWMSSHSALDGSHGDCFIFNASSPEQLEETLLAVAKGTLTDDASTRIDNIWRALDTQR